MTTTLNRFNGYSLSAFICGVFAVISNFAGVLGAILAELLGGADMLFGLSGLLMIAGGFAAVWAVTGGIIALNTPVRRLYAVLSVVSGGLTLLWLLCCVFAAAAS
jgi:hypothetical protein